MWSVAECSKKIRFKAATVRLEESWSEENRVLFIHADMVIVNKYAIPRLANNRKGEKNLKINEKKSRSRAMWNKTVKYVL